MSYSRPPNTIFAGTALNQVPPPNPKSPAGWVPDTLNANIATTSSLGVVQVGNNLSNTPGGILSAITPIGSPGYYGSFYDTTTQTNPVVNEANILQLNTTSEADGVSIVDGTKATVTHSGVYKIQFAVQLAKTTGADHNIDIWLRKNGTDVPDTNTVVTLFGSDSRAAASWDFVLTLLAGEYIEIAWSSDFPTMELLYLPPQIGPIRPATPSAFLTVVQVRAL